MTIFGLGISSAVRAAEHTLQLAEQADQQGLDLFSVSDHPYYSAVLDAYSMVGVALGRTRRISAMVNVTNLPVRPVPMLARTVTSLSTLSGGRVMLGLGAGGAWDEIVKLGPQRLSPGAAVRQFEEAFVLLRQLAGGGKPVTFDGEFYRVQDLQPARVALPPIYTGSNGPKSLAVTGRHADGWLPGHAADWLSHRYRTSRPIIDEAAVAAGRSPSDIATVYNFPGVITPQPLPSTRDAEGRWVGGSVEQWIDELTGAVLEHGASGFILFPSGNDPLEVTLGRWAQEIVPAVREAVAKAE